VNKEHTIVIPADPDDPEDRDVSIAGLERAYIGRRFRMLRHRLGMSQSEFAAAYGIPVANLRQYETARHMPPPAVRSYLKVIEVEPDMVKRVVGA
jgi:putative transcriptional regulator